MGVTHHIRIPLSFTCSNPGLLIIPRPIFQIYGMCISNPIPPVFILSEVGSMSETKKHMIVILMLDNRWQSLAFVFIQFISDNVLTLSIPINSVGRNCMDDLINSLGCVFSRGADPLRTVYVPHMIGIVKYGNKGISNQEGFIQRGGNNRAASNFFKREPLICTNG